MPMCQARSGSRSLTTLVPSKSAALWFWFVTQLSLHCLIADSQRAADWLHWAHTAAGCLLSLK